MIKTFSKFALLLVTAYALTACGIKGKLDLPDETEGEIQTK
jgi:predicted small lipoprotein YifL